MHQRSCCPACRAKPGTSSCCSRLLRYAAKHDALHSLGCSHLPDAPSTSAVSSSGSRPPLPHRIALQPAAPAALHSLEFMGHSRIHLWDGFVFSKRRSFSLWAFLKTHFRFNPDVLSFISALLNASFSACVCVSLSKRKLPAILLN